jgi:hypothetical protein
MRDGTEIVVNPDTPLLEGAQATWSEVWSVKPADWMDPSRVHVQGRRVVVVDPPANEVHLVSTSGEILRSLGRPGGGPGEFLRLLDALPDGDKLVVIDGGKSSIETLDFDGGYLSSLHVEGQSWGGFLLGGGELLLEGEFLSDPAGQSFGDWVRVGAGVDLTAFTTVLLPPLQEEEGVQCSGFSPWAGGAARMRSTTPQIQVFDHTGDLQREVLVSLPLERVSEDEREWALANLRHSLSERGLPPEFVQQNLAVTEERWRVKCRFGPLRWDSSGLLGAFLEQNPDEFGGGNASLHLLSPEGVYLAELTFQEAWTDFTMEDGVVYALAREAETDLITLRAFRIDLPSSSTETASSVLKQARDRSIGVP